MFTKEQLESFYSNVKSIFTIKTGVLLMAMAFIILIVNLNTTAYVISYNEEEIIAVRKEKDIEKLIEKLKEDYSKEQGLEEAKLSDEYVLKRVRRLESQLTEEKDTEEILKDLQFQIEAYSLSIEGEEIGKLKNPEEIERILEEIKKPYIKQAEDLIIKGIKYEKAKSFSNEEVLEEIDQQIKDIDLKELQTTIKDGYIIEFLEDIEIKETTADIEELNDTEEIKNKIIAGTKKYFYHTVNKNTNLTDLSEELGIDEEEILILNPDLEEEIEKETELLIHRQTPLLTVMTEFTYTGEEIVDFEIETEYTADLYDDEIEIQVEGIKGRNILEKTETRINGILAKKAILNEDIVREAKTQKQLKGTTERPKTVATGTFIRPINGTLTSPFGMRWGRLHSGIDLIDPIGTPIYASDGGVVKFSGEMSGYGNIIEIDHENGYSTRYAHNNLHHVKVGDRVFQGQHIADVGNTGRSSGPHVHFEILLNGNAIDPIGLLK